MGYNKTMKPNMISREILEAAAKRPANRRTWRKLAIAASKAGMNFTDTYDLLREFDCPRDTATVLLAG